MKTKNLVTFGCLGLKMSTREPSRKTEQAVEYIKWEQRLG